MFFGKKYIDIDHQHIGLDGGIEQSRVTSMNHPAQYGGFTIFQSSYSQEGGRTMSVLSVSRDPGQPIVFAGYIMMILGMVVVLGGFIWLF